MARLNQRFPVTSEECHRAATVLEETLEQAVDREVTRLVANSLREMGDKHEEYTSGLQVCSSFLEEAHGAIRLLCTEADRVQRHTWVFSLLECMVIMARERALRKGTQQLLPTQAEVLRFFVKSGHWHEDDDTLVNRYFHWRLPDATRTPQE